MKETHDTQGYLRQTVLSLLAGAAAGAAAAIYRLLGGWADSVCGGLYGLVREHPLWIPLLLTGLAGLGILVGFLCQAEPMIKGSGIPQAEGQARGLLAAKWYRVLPLKLLGGVLAALAGLSLGREGPSIQLGAAAGEGVAAGLKRDETARRYLLTCGASAGLAAAFNAPLAGVLFVLEEMHQSFSPRLMLGAMVAAAAGEFLSRAVFGMGPVLNFGQLAILPLPLCFLAPALGVALGAAGWLYNKTLLAVQRGYDAITIVKRSFVMGIPFLAAGLTGLLAPSLLGGGQRILDILSGGQVALLPLIALLIGKFLFSMVSFCSGAPGGIFFPLLVLGALIGGIFGGLLQGLPGMTPEYQAVFLLLGMAGMFTGVVRAPVTGIVLIAEMAQAPAQLLPLALTSAAAWLTAQLLRSEPIYDSLLRRLTGPSPSKD